MSAAGGGIVHKDARLFTRKELAESVGDAPVLRLAILGKVYDVSKGRKHYGKDAGYSFFAGRDGSKAFVTGNVD
jgi:cytochrome b involved in lipid metabolism